jgi:hypothetical protein
MGPSLVRREHRRRAADRVELGKLGRGVRVGAAQARAYRADHEAARGVGAGDQLVAAGLGAVVPQREQAALARREIRRHGPQSIDVALHQLGGAREL